MPSELMPFVLMPCTHAGRHPRHSFASHSCSYHVLPHPTPPPQLVDRFQGAQMRRIKRSCPKHEESVKRDMQQCKAVPEGRGTSIDFTLTECLHQHQHYLEADASEPWASWMLGSSEGEADAGVFWAEGKMPGSGGCLGGMVARGLTSVQTWLLRGKCAVGAGVCELAWMDLD
eukprot:1160294-Pelagomonas_calceolata.AAC.8